MQSNNKRKRNLYVNIIGEYKKNIKIFEEEIQKYEKKMKILDLKIPDENGNKLCKINFQGNILETPKSNYYFSEFLKITVRECNESDEIPFINIDIKIIKIFMRYFNKCKDPDLLKKNFSYKELLYYSDYLIINNLVKDIKVGQEIQITHRTFTQLYKVKSIDNINFTYNVIKFPGNYEKEKTHNIKFH